MLLYNQIIVTCALSVEALYNAATSDYFSLWIYLLIIFSIIFILFSKHILTFKKITNTEIGRR